MSWPFRRYENIGVSLEEYFVGRTDRLASRKAKYGPPDVTALGALAGSAAQRRGSLMLNPALARRDAGREGADRCACSLWPAAQNASCCQC